MLGRPTTLSSLAREMMKLDPRLQAHHLRPFSVAHTRSSVIHSWIGGVGNENCQTRAEELAPQAAPLAAHKIRIAPAAELSVEMISDYFSTAHRLGYERRSS